MENLVEIKEVNFAYDARPVLKGINMQVRRGAVITIMGLSGCGKTTLLRLIGGALKPKSGEVRVAGRLMSELDQDALYAMRRRMGMLFQFGALYTDLSVFDNVAFQMREHTQLPESMVRDLVLMKLNAVGLRGARDLMPSELSGGMARRVALARAIALDLDRGALDRPARTYSKGMTQKLGLAACLLSARELYVLDEPTGGLDPKARALFKRELRALHKGGGTVFFTSHALPDVAELCDRVAVLHDGRLLFAGTPDELMRRRGGADLEQAFLDCIAAPGQAAA